MNAEIGRVLDDRYRLVAPIGMGASAKVFLADDVRLRRRVALKMLHDALADDPVFLRRFRAEAQAAAALGHPNVMTVYDWGDDETAYIVTEYLGGGSLRAILDRGETLSPSQALTVGLEAARALDYAHRRGFVHRDIKPANLLFGEDGRLRIADFGLARALAEAAWTEPQGAMLGTVRYAAPEQAKGEKLSGKADVYALALVLVETVTGDVPFRADTTLGTLMARVDRPLEVPDTLGPLAAVITRAGHPDPDQRIDARTLAAGLLRAAKELPRPEPLPLVGALEAAEHEPEVDRTLHAPLLPPDPPSDVGPELTEDDLDLDPPDWVSGGEPTATVIPLPTQLSVGGDDEPAPLDDLDHDDDDDEHDPTPRRRRRWPYLVALVLLLVGAGGVATAMMREKPPEAPPAPPITLPVPLVGGLGEEDARRVLESGGWKVEIKHTRRVDTKDGDVLESDPAPGTRLSKGETVTLVVSKGQPMVEVPGDLGGRPVDEVTAALEKIGLRAEIATEEHHEEIAAGSVIRLVEGTPDKLERSSAVELVVSAGPRPREVPGGLTGSTQKKATEAIEAVQLEVAVEKVHSDDVDEGVVMGQSPEGGTLPRGGTVTITVSAGPELVAVPDISWTDSPKQAAAVLRNAGLVPGKVTGPAEGSPSATKPAYGTEVRKGTEIDIIID